MDATRLRPPAAQSIEMELQPACMQSKGRALVCWCGCCTPLSVRLKKQLLHV